MALSPNYGWSEPDNTDLVKNGAQAMRTLGDAIDTSLWNVGFGQAGKNKIINGDFSINQRTFSSTTISGTYIYDRYNVSLSGGTVTFSAQNFTAGAAPVAGYEGKNYLRMVTSGQVGSSDFAGFSQFIESVRTFAGQTVTVSFWAKAATGTPSIAPVLQQNFGTGGSPSTTVQINGTGIPITTSWARYSQTFNVPSISGKTIGTNNNDFFRLGLWGSLGSSLTTFPAIGLQNNTFDFWGIQVEAGSKATPFQTATGTIQGELAACQRYYYRTPLTSDNYKFYGSGSAYSTSAVALIMPIPVTLRVNPSVLEYTALTLTDPTGLVAFTTLALGYASPHAIGLLATGASGLTQYRPYMISSSSTTGYIGISAEL